MKVLAILLVVAVAAEGRHNRQRSQEPAPVDDFPPSGDDFGESDLPPTNNGGGWRSRLPRIPRIPLPSLPFPIPQFWPGPQAPPPPALPLPPAVSSAPVHDEVFDKILIGIFYF